MTFESAISALSAKLPSASHYFAHFAAAFVSGKGDKFRPIAIEHHTGYVTQGDRYEPDFARPSCIGDFCGQTPRLDEPDCAGRRRAEDTRCFFRVGMDVGLYTSALGS